MVNTHKSYSNLPIQAVQEIPKSIYGTVQHLFDYAKNDLSAEVEKNQDGKEMSIGDRIVQNNTISNNLENVKNILSTEEHSESADGLAMQYLKKITAISPELTEMLGKIFPIVGTQVGQMKKDWISGMGKEQKKEAIATLDGLSKGLQGRVDVMNEWQKSNPVPENILTNTVKGVSGMIPDLAAASLLGAPGAEGVAMKYVAGLTKNAPEIIARLAPKAVGLLERSVKAPFTKVLTAKGLVEGGAANTDNPTIGLIEGGAKGFGEGMYMHILGEGAGVVNPYLAKLIGKTGATSDISTAISNPLANAGVFMAAKAARTPIEEGRMATPQELENEFGMGIGFSLLHAGSQLKSHQEANDFYEKTLKSDPQVSLGKALNEMPEILKENYVPNADIQKLEQARDEIKKAVLREPDLAQKKQLGQEAINIQNQLDASEAIDGIISNKKSVVEVINNLPELTPEQKSAYTQRIEEISAEFEPTKVAKEQLSKQIEDAQSLVEQHTENAKNATNIVDKIENEVKARKAQEIVDSATKELTNVVENDILTNRESAIKPKATEQETVIKNEILNDKIDQSVKINEQLAEQLANATTPEEVAIIKAMAEKSNKQGIESTQELNKNAQTNPEVQGNAEPTRVVGAEDVVLPETKVEGVNGTPKQQSESTSTSLDVAIGNESSGGIEQSTIHPRKKGLVEQRIKPEETAQPTKNTKKINQIIKDVADELDATLIYAQPGGKNAAGTYNPSNTLIKIRNAGDIDVSAHEIGHLIDDRYDLLGNKPTGNAIKGRIKDSIEKEIKWYSDRGGSNPPSSMDLAGKKKYLQREGFGEFIRAYIANPKEAKRVSPELYDYFEGAIDEKTKSALQKFSRDYIDFANSTAGEQVLANIEDMERKKPGIKEWLMGFSKEKKKFHISPLDKLKAQMVNSLTVANKAFEYILENKEIESILPEKNFETLARLLSGVNGKITRILDTGLVNAKNEFIISSDGSKMNLKWLFSELDSSSEKAIKNEMDEVIKLLVAERTMEYSAKFNRTSDLTGVGAGIKNDLAVAETHLSDFEALRQSEPEKYERIKISASRYREYADAGLRYAVEKGRMSEEQYREIKENNQYYVSLARVNEIAPTEEPLAFINKYSKGGLTSVKELIKSAKGGTGTIQNPYLSLIKNTTDIIREADRNEVMRSFIEPLSNIRNMGDGRPIDFSSIARKVSPGEKNAKNIYINGKKETWQFQDDIYDSLTGISGIASNWILNVAATPGDILRWTVTHSPFFAAKNVDRDFFSRVILSRSGSGIKDLAHNLNDRQLFDLYGGSQSGYHLINKNAYAKQLKNTITEITESGKASVLDPRNIAKGWNWYEKLLEKGENINRIAEFKAAFKQGKANGLDDYNAGLQAAFEARDTLDFAVAGHTMKIVNRLIPFSNAGIQGLRRSALSAKENPGRFAARIALVTVLPQLLVRAIVLASGDQDEYEQLPAHQRDLFWTFRTPLTGDKWICIPKPFDLGLPSSFVDRCISSALGNDHAFEGFSYSMLKVLIPFDEGSIMGAFKPIVEGFMNKDTFRDAPIIPHWEEKRLLKNREGTKYASTVSKYISKAMGLTGAETDPRYIDHYIKGQFSYYGDWALSLSDLASGNDESRNKITISKTGMIKDAPVANAQAVKDVYNLAAELGYERSAAVKKLSGRIKKYYEIQGEEQRRKVANEIYTEAIRLRTFYEKLKAKELKRN